MAGCTVQYSVVQYCTVKQQQSSQSGLLRHSSINWQTSKTFFSTTPHHLSTSMSWQSYVDDQLLSTKVIKNAVIAGHDGNIWATSAGFPVSLQHSQVVHLSLQQQRNCHFTRISYKLLLWNMSLYFLRAPSLMINEFSWVQFHLFWSIKAFSNNNPHHYIDPHPVYFANSAFFTHFFNIILCLDMHLPSKNIY